MQNNMQSIYFIVCAGLCSTDKVMSNLKVNLNDTVLRDTTRREKRERKSVYQSMRDAFAESA